MKTLRLFTLLLCLGALFSCSKDDDTTPVYPVAPTPYPETMVQYPFDGFISEFDNGSGVNTGFQMQLEANGDLTAREIKNNVVTNGTGTWSLSGTIFRCTYTLTDGKKYTIEGILSLDNGYNILGYRGINDATTGAGKVQLLIV